MARVIKLQNGTDTLLPISDATAIQMTVDNNTKSVQDVILENEEIFAAAMTDLNSQMQDISYQLENMPDAIDESTVSGWGFTKNQGTITGINMNGASKGTSGVVDLGTVITSETQLSKGTTTGSGNAVTDISVSNHQITLTKGKTFLESFTETDPTVPSYVKGITESDISYWNGKSELFTINFVYNGLSITSCDKTFVQIKAAHDSGKILRAVINNGFAFGNITQVTATAIIFNVVDTQSNNKIVSYELGVYDNDTYDIIVSTIYADNYLTEETDPIFSESAAANIQSSDITKWNSSYCPVVVDTRTSAANVVTANAPFDSLKDGQQIILVTNYATSGSSTLPTLNLTLSNNTTTGGKAMYYHRNGSQQQIGSSNFQMPAGVCIASYVASNNAWYTDWHYLYYSNLSAANIDSSNTGNSLVSGSTLRSRFYTKTEINNTIAGLSTVLGETDDFTITL